MQLDHPYLTSQLIAYIGNKRALLGFLSDVFTTLAREHEIKVFLDPFAGSGSVSRLGKYLGYRVLSNDWEPYSRVLNTAHVAVDQRDADGLFSGTLGETVDEINRLETEAPSYISRYYAPRNTGAADYRTERLFYTAENGAFIDRVRHIIEERYPGWDLSSDDLSAKALLLSALLYQAATHANTSGVFKAFHKGFGGHGKDAMKRITAPMRLLTPVLIDGRRQCEVFGMEASEFAAGAPADLCYLDPPYNQHQYGSNYHLLNTLVEWDCPEYPLETGPDGRLKNKAGIRRDWTRTRSDYCYRARAGEAMKNLLDTIDARHIALSYNTEGIIPFEELVDILGRHGKLTLYSSDYVTYRGGRQSMTKPVHNAEFLIVCTRGGVTPASVKDSLLRFRKLKRISLLLRGTFHPARIRENFISLGDGRTGFRENGRELIFETAGPCRIRMSSTPDAAGADDLSDGGLDLLIDLLGRSRFRDYREECLYLVQAVAAMSPACRDRRSIERRFVQLLKKIAHKKYRAEFREVMDEARKRILLETEEFSSLGKKIVEIERIADLRIQG